MFTGLIQEIATVKEINSHHGDIQAVFSIDENLNALNDFSPLNKKQIEDNRRILKSLISRDNMIKSIKGMDKLQNLYSKDLFNNRVMSIEGLETLTSLERFIVKKEPFSGFPI